MSYFYLNNKLIGFGGLDENSFGHGPGFEASTSKEKEKNDANSFQRRSNETESTVADDETFLLEKILTQVEAEENEVLGSCQGTEGPTDETDSGPVRLQIIPKPINNL